ncbi:hypothetical protein OJ253_1851 [Cryptosporidium canis]|uniref:Uncharacterized protein n=1 Tax=Cryptosporidium canis TaxID=195482 RepID=A0A9D5HXI1_9CRYT|nr:hypothetical protein OJ253_1851 [Cryptosporidium canis]
MGDTPDTRSPCKKYLDNELVLNNENQLWNLGEASEQDSGLHSLKQGCPGSSDPRLFGVGGQMGVYDSSSGPHRMARGNYDIVENIHDISMKGGASGSKQFEVVNSGYVTPRTEYVSPTPEISSSGGNYSFQSAHSPNGIGAGSAYLSIKALQQIPETDIACRLYGSTNSNHNNFGVPIDHTEVGPVPLIPTAGDEASKSPSARRVGEQGFVYSDITRSERIYSEYQAATKKDVCPFNMGEPTGHSSVMEIPESCGPVAKVDGFRHGVGLAPLPDAGSRHRVDSVPNDYQYNVYYGTANQEQNYIVPSENQSYVYNGMDASREGNGSCQPAIAEYIEYSAPGTGNYVNNGTVNGPDPGAMRECTYSARGNEMYNPSINDRVGVHCNYYPVYTNPAPAYINPNHPGIQGSALREADLLAECAPQYRAKQANEVYDQFGYPHLPVGGGASGVVSGLPAPPNIPMLSGMNGFHGVYAPHAFQGFPPHQVGLAHMDAGEDHCLRKRRRPGTAGNDRNFYIVDFICEIPVNIKDLFMSVLKDSTEGPRILREFALGSLAMRRSGNLTPTVIKCFFHSYRDGISRLQCKSKRHEGRPFLFVINETKLSRPWVFCPNVKCIRRAKSSGKLKGRIKVYEYCPGSDKMILSPTFLKCARGFLTSDYYFCATLCPQQKYADHESNFWGEDFVTGFGGDLIQETLTNETEHGGNLLTLADYILFCNSKHQFVATFRRFSNGARPCAPPAKNSSYVNASSLDGIFGDENELSLVNIMTSVIRTLEGSNEPTVYASTDQFIHEVSLSSGGSAMSQSNGFNRQIMQPIGSRDCSFGHPSRGDANSLEHEETGIGGGVQESSLRRVEGISASGKWNESPHQSFSGVNGLQQPADHAEGQRMYISGDFAGSAKDERSSLYPQSSSLDIEDPFSNKLETYSTGYTDEDSFSTFNDSGAQLSLNFDPQDALVVESSTNWVLDVLLNKPSDCQSYTQTPIHNSQELGSNHSGNYSTDLGPFDHQYNVHPKSQNSAKTSPSQNPSLVDTDSKNDGFDYEDEIEHENITSGNGHHSF